MTPDSTSLASLAESIQRSRYHSRRRRPPLLAHQSKNSRSRLADVAMLAAALMVLPRPCSAWISNQARHRSLGVTTRSTEATLVRLQFFSSQKKTTSKLRHSGKDTEGQDLPSSPKKRNANAASSIKKFQVVDKIEQRHLEKLAQAFDELAISEGFDSSHALFADDATFEDDDAAFEDDDDDDDLFIDIDDDSDEDDNGDTEPNLTTDYEHPDSDDDDMDARIREAALERDSGGSKRPTEIDNFSSVAAAKLKQLGFQREQNPFGNDETPRQQQFQVIRDAMVCTACGSDFQCQDDAKPGYLPPEKYQIQVKLRQLEDAQSVQEKAESQDEWSPEAEVEWLLQTSNVKATAAEAATIDDEAMAQEADLDLDDLPTKNVICKRCHGLQNFGKVDDALRPGWTAEPLLSQEKFRSLLKPIRAKPAVIIALVDLFDFSGSVLPELDTIAGENPVILAANKIDLFPTSMGPTRVENWVRRELEYLGVKSLANMGGAVRLISCKTGHGVSAMMAKARALAEDIGGDIYVVGAANAGKSTLLNHILSYAQRRNSKAGKRRAGNANKSKGDITTSPLPGTTLKFIRVDLGDGQSLYDTPGLLVPGTLTHVLTPEELKVVVPNKQVEPVTFRVASGKCVLLGGLARIELIGDSKPFLFTFFVANDIKLHPTDSSRADAFVERHVGEILTPPFFPAKERLQQLGELEDHVIDIEGTGWKEAAADISLTGLGWVSVTGAGTATVKVSVPKGIGVSLRPPLMPYDVWETTAKYTGSRAVRKSTKLSSGKRRKGVGRS